VTYDSTAPINPTDPEARLRAALQAVYDQRVQQDAEEVRELTETHADLIAEVRAQVAHNPEITLEVGNYVFYADSGLRNAARAFVTICYRGVRVGIRLVDAPTRYELLFGRRYPSEIDSWSWRSPDYSISKDITLRGVAERHKRRLTYEITSWLGTLLWPSDMLRAQPVTAEAMPAIDLSPQHAETYDAFTSWLTVLNALSQTETTP
jgi:hypothetical protein